MRPRPSPLAVALLVVAGGALLWHGSLYRYFVTDDAYISFVYARNLAEHGQLVFNLGERVEGYTNFLWTVILAGLLRLGWLPELSSIVLGVGLALGTMALSAVLSARLWAAGRDGGERPALGAWDALPALLLAAIPGYACWAGGGLETQLFTFLLTAGVGRYLVRGPDAASGALIGLAALTRPEGDLFFALLVLHCSIARLLGRRPLVDGAALRFGAAFALLVGPHFLWRHAYYGWWLPNTFYIKSSGGQAAWGLGGHYLWRFHSDYLLPVFYALAVGGALLHRSIGVRRLVGVLAVLLPVFHLYVASVGGDFMGLYRFALPVVPLSLLGGALGLRALLERLAPRPSWLGAPVAAALLGGLCLHDVPVVREALRDPPTLDNGVIDTPAFLRHYTEDRAAIGRWFGANRQPDDYAAVGGAGAQVYFSRMRSLDCFGLSDEYIAHHVPAVSSRPGHQKYAPVEYQLSRHPTIITSNYYNIGPAPLVRDDAPLWRQRGYHYVSVEVPGLSSRWYTFLKRMDRRVGPLGPVDADLQ